MTELIGILNKYVVPTYTEPAPMDAKAPYATVTLSEQAIVTCSGIAGYEGVLTVIVYAPTTVVAKRLADAVVFRLHDSVMDGRKFSLSSKDSESYPDVGLISIELTFNTLQ